MFFFSLFETRHVYFDRALACHSDTPVVSDPKIQQNILGNKVGLALTATNNVADLLLHFMQTIVFHQSEPNKNHETGEYHTPHDQESWS
jgi:hypothetical protein